MIIPDGCFVAGVVHPANLPILLCVRYQIIGDVSGDYPSFEQRLKASGVKDDIIPRDLLVVQLGDLTRAENGFAESNEKVVDAVQRLMDKNPNNYVQLFGNHEMGALGGEILPTWNPSKAYTVKTRKVLEDWWEHRKALLAWGGVSDMHGATLFTHAGLTRARFAGLGVGVDLAAVVEALNRSVGVKTPESYSTPGLLGTSLNFAADVTWAEASHEVYVPWMQHKDMPFVQVHSHSSPYCWMSDMWWPGTPVAVKKNTTLSVDLRRTVTRVGPGKHQFVIGVGWLLGGNLSGVPQVGSSNGESKPSKPGKPSKANKRKLFDRKTS